MSQTFADNLLPTATGLDLGSATQRWDLYVQNIDVSGTVGGIVVTAPSATQTITQPVNTSLTIATGGVIISGLTGSSATFRTDSQLELQGAAGAHGLLSIFQGDNPGTTTEESAIAFGKYNDAGQAIKVASVSAKTADPADVTGYGVLRLNATYNDGANDDVAIRIWGNKGIGIWNSSDTVAPSAGRFYGTYAQNGSTAIQWENTTNGTAASAIFQVAGGQAISTRSLILANYAPANTASLFGLTIGNYSALYDTGASSLGIILGMAADVPVYFGSNNAIIGAFRKTGLTITAVNGGADTAALVINSASAGTARIYSQNNGSDFWNIPFIHGADKRVIINSPTKTFLALSDTNNTVTLGPNSSTVTTVNGNVALVDEVSKYKNISTVANGISSILAVSNLTSQGAAIGATTIYAVPAAGQGMYRITWVATITRAGSVSSTLGGATGFQVIFTDPNDSVVKTSNPTAVTDMISAANTTGTAVGGVATAYCKASTNLQYAFGYTDGGGTTMQYDLNLIVEALG